MEIHNQQFLEVLIIGIFGSFVLGHNLWLVARSKNNGKIRVEVNTSDSFPQSDSAVRPERIADFRLISKSNSQPIKNFAVEENSLVAEVEPLNDSAFCLALELHPHPISLEAEKFARYIEDEDAQEFVASKFTAGETVAPQRESYAKFAKTFYGLNHNQTNEAFNLALGQRFEIVPQIFFADLREGATMRVLVLFENAPVKNLRVSFGGENLNDGDYARHARTDSNGISEIEISTSGLCFLRTHLIRPHADSDNFEWESFWASFTFYVPPR